MKSRDYMPNNAQSLKGESTRTGKGIRQETFPD